MPPTHVFPAASFHGEDFASQEQLLPHSYRSFHLKFSTASYHHLGEPQRRPHSSLSRALFAADGLHFRRARIAASQSSSSLSQPQNADGASHSVSRRGGGARGARALPRRVARHSRRRAPPRGRARRRLPRRRRPLRLVLHAAPQDGALRKVQDDVVRPRVPARGLARGPRRRVRAARGLQEPRKPRVAPHRARALGAPPPRGAPLARQTPPCGARGRGWLPARRG
jgi:hypothetical protein